MKITTFLRHMLIMEESVSNNKKNYDSVLNEYRIYDEKKIENDKLNYWKEIESLGWYWLTKRGFDNNPNDELASILVEKYNLNEIIELHNFVVTHRIKLQSFLQGYYKSSPKEFKKQVKLSDDGLWDFSSHMVGLGEVMFNYVLDHPDSILELQKDYTENFEYGFDKAIYQIQNKG